MAKVRLYPHRIAAPDVVSWGDWWVERDGQVHALEPTLRGWDYATECRLGLHVAVDMQGIVASARIADPSELELIAIADCRATQTRAMTRISGEGVASKPVELSLALAPGEFAQEVQLSAHLVLARDRPRARDRSAVTKGARLASSEVTRLRLEGDAGRFPTEPIPFSSQFLGDAPWRLLTTYEDLDESFLSSVRLLINTEHPVGLLALDPSSASQVEPLLRTDVVRQLIAAASKRLGQRADVRYEEGSVGDVLSAISQLFLGRGLQACLQLYDEDPEAFESLLHERLQPTSVVLKP